MSTRGASGWLAAEERVVRLVRRPDLIVRRVAWRRRGCWVVKDPLAGRFYLLGDEEQFLWAALDGRTTLAELRRVCQQRFAPREFSLARLQSAVARFYEQGLVRAESAGQGQSLWAERQRRATRRRAQAAANFLTWRFRGIDPEPGLRWVTPRLARVLAGWGPWAYVALLLAGAAAAWSCASELAGEGIELGAFLSPRLVAGLAVTLGLVKVAHELGHALVHTHFGGRCHELGVMLLVGVPCLYCDVSDAWLLPSKWRRMAVSAAGMAVELAIAAAAAIVFWATSPGPLHSAAWSLVWVTSVGTVLFNGNPLLRYDGYFLLTDLAEVPNLAERSGTWWRQVLGGGEAGHDGALGPADPWWLPLYAPASVAYRLLLLAGVWWFLRELTEPYHATWLAWTLVGLAGGAGMGPSLASTFRSWTRPEFSAGEGERRHRLAWLVAAAGLATAILSVPIPAWVSAPVVIEPVAAQRVYASVAGRVTSHARRGARVEPGELLVELVDPDQELAWTALDGERTRQARRLANLERLRGRDRAAEAELPTARQRLDDLDAQWRQRRADRERLRIVAARAGMVIPVAPGGESAADDLPAVTQSLVDEDSRGAAVGPGTLVCLVGDPRELEAWAAVEQAAIERLVIGQRVSLRLDAWPQERLAGRVVEVAQAPLVDAPLALVRTRALATRETENGWQQPLEATYQVRLALDPGPWSLTPGGVGWARIHVSAESLATRLGRAWRRAVGFRPEGGR